MKNLGFSYDWSKLVNSMEPEYYKWNQLFFLKFLEKGLAYRKKAAVNWCPKCNTVLANEQVVGGCCWRHEDTEVEIKHLEQWFLKITDYANELLDCIDGLEWPQKIKTMQKNWIGKSYGTEIDFEIENNKDKISNVVIVPAKVKDAESISFIQISGWRDNNTSLETGITIDFLEKEKGFTLPPKKERVESTKKYIKGNPENNYVAIIDKKVVGWVGLTFHDKKKISYGVYVHPEYRGKSVGKSLINFVHKKYADYEFFIEVVSTNKRAIKLYENIGYVKKSKGKHKIGDLFLPVDVMCYENQIILKRKFPVFTTRPDTLYGVTFMVVSAQHEKLMELVTKEQKKEVEKFLKKLKSVSEKELETMEKLGVFTGSYAINPINGEKVPVYAGNFVIAEYGSGMVMGVPAHDQRDFEFAKKYKIEIRQVIEGEFTNKRSYTGSGKLINSDKLNGVENEKAKEEITKLLIKKKAGRKSVQFNMRDWLISRQRYWGTPIPIVYCDECGIVAVPEKELPIKLPERVKFGKGNPLATNKEFVNVKCPKCKGKACRETDTMDTFVDSSWYFMRYADNKNKKEPFDKKIQEYWLPVDQYIGGIEHATMHLLYARFWTKALRDLGYVKYDEPFTKLFNQGMLHGEDGEKMSKSKGNVILPEIVSEKYGIDTARFFLMSLAAPDKPRDWSDKGVLGSLKFINKIMDYFETVKIGKSEAKIESKLNKTIKDVTGYIEDFKYNLAVIKIRDLFNSLPEKTSKGVLEKSLKLLHVFCPHITEELWSKIKGKGFISLAEWPEVNEKKINERFEKEDELVKKLKIDIIHVKELTGKKDAKVYVYVLPNELEFYKNIGGAKVFSVNDKKKYDPENKSKKVKPGRPGIYLE